MAAEVNEGNLDRAVRQSEKIKPADFQIPGCVRCMVLVPAAEAFD